MIINKAFVNIGECLECAWRCLNHRMKKTQTSRDWDDASHLRSRGSYMIFGISFCSLCKGTEYLFWCKGQAVEPLNRPLAHWHCERAPASEIASTGPVTTHTV